MPRCSTIHISEPKEWFSCLVANCTAKFRPMNGRTQHIHAKHTSDKPQHDDLQDFLMVSQSWIRSSSPQLYAMHEDTLQPDDYEPPIALYASRSPSQAINLISDNDNDFQPQLFEELHSSSPSFCPSSPPSYQDEPKERMPTTEYHLFINGEYILTFSFSIYLLNKRYRQMM